MATQDIDIQDAGYLQRIKDYFAEQVQYKIDRDRMILKAQEESAPSAGQMANFGGMLLPGAGIAEAAGEYPALPSSEQPFSEAFSNEPYPSMAENLKRGGFGGYFDAAMQGLGIAGDATYGIPVIGAAVGPTIGTVFKATGAAGKAARTAGKGIAALDRTRQALRADVQQFAKDDFGFTSPTIQALIERAPPNLKGPQITEWAKANANKGVKPKELEFLGLDEFVAANPNATTREAVEGISGNKVRVSQNIYSGDNADLEFDVTFPDNDPLDGSNLWQTRIEDIFAEINRPHIKKDLLDHYNQEWDVAVESFDDIPKSMIDEVAEDFAKTQYRADPYELIETYGQDAVGSKINAFAFGNEEAGYQIFVDGERVTDTNNVAYSRTEAEIQLQETLGGEKYGFGGTRFKTYVDESLPGGSNYREVVFNWDNAPVEHNIGHFDEDPTQIAHALIRDRKLADGTDSLHIDELQSDVHTQGAKNGYDNPETRKAIQTKLDNNEKLLLPAIEDLKSKVLAASGNNPKRIKIIDRIFDNLKDSQIASKISLEQASGDLGRVNSYLFNELNLSGDFLKSFNEMSDLFNNRKFYANDANKLVPNYPYKKDWYDMGLKKLLLQAAEEGKPALSISGSAPMKARYSEQYHKFYEMLYDKKIPSAMKKLANKYGGKFEEGRLDVDDTFTQGRVHQLYESDPDVLPANIIRITPEMRERILEEGIQAFGTGGIVDSGIAHLKRDSATKYAEGGEVTDQNVQRFKELLKKVGINKLYEIANLKGVRLPSGIGVDSAADVITNELLFKAKIPVQKHGDNFILQKQLRNGINLELDLNPKEKYGFLNFSGEFKADGGEVNSVGIGRLSR